MLERPGLQLAHRSPLSKTLSLLLYMSLTSGLMAALLHCPPLLPLPLMRYHVSAGEKKSGLWSEVGRGQQGPKRREHSH